MLGFIARETKTKASYFCLYLFMLQSRCICFSQVSAGSPSDLSWIISNYYLPKEGSILGLAILSGTKSIF